MSDEFHPVASTEQRDETRDLFYAQIGSRRNISALVGAQYLGFVYGAGVFANGIPLVRIVAFADK
jgi:hypothetical protein